MGNERPSTFTWIYAAGAIVLVLVTIFAVTFAFRNTMTAFFLKSSLGQLGITGYRR
jgi:hypothetical protein